MLEEKAKRFMSGELINTDAASIPQQMQISDDGKITKEKFWHFEIKTYLCNVQDQGTRHYCLECDSIFLCHNGFVSVKI